MCAGHHEWEVAEITFNFWYRLSELIYQADYEKVSPPFVPYISRLIEALYRHCQIDTDHEGILQEQDDFFEFRDRVQELIKDVAFICGAKNIFCQMSAILQLPINSQWNNMEAALFVMQSIAKNMLPSEDEYIPPVMEAVLQQNESVHIQVMHTSLLLIAELSDWLSCHRNYLPRTLTFLTKKLHNPHLATASARALDAVCQSCRDHIEEHFDGLMSIATSLDSFSISNEAVVGLLKGVSSILGRLPKHKIQIYMKNLCATQVNNLQRLLTEEKPENTKNTSMDPAVWLDRLSAIFRSVNPIIINGEPHPCQEVVMEIWPTLAETFNQYSLDLRIMEHCCRCIRFAVRCVHQQSAPLLPALVELIVKQYTATGFSCFVYLGSILVDEYASSQGCLPGLLTMLQAFMTPTFALLCKPNGFKDHPDTVDDWFRLCTRFLQRAPIPFLQSNVIHSIIECGLQACLLDHKDANAAVLKFFQDLISTGMKQEDKDDFKTRRKLVENILQKNGQLLVNNLVTAALFILPNLMLRDVAETFYLLMLFDRPSFCVMLEKKLKEMPLKNTAGLVTIQHSQLVEVHKNMTKATRAKDISKILSEFARYYT